MIHILIVDDEDYVVNDIKTNVNWDRLGVSEVYTAFSMRQATEVFMKNAIDIMLCDIEMPHGNGLELLSWVQENYPKTQSIFLTCHADFYYAKEAIRLGSLDYLLKPIHFPELEESVMKAIGKISADNKMNKYSKYGEYWIKSQPMLIERFWIDILNHTIPSDQEYIRKTADHRNIPYTDQIKILPVLIRIQRWHKKQSLQDEKIMEFGLKNIAEEILIAEGENGIFFSLHREIVIGIILPGNATHSGSDSLEERCKDFISKSCMYLECDLSCYIGTDVFAHELVQIVDKLLLLDKNNVAYINKVFLLSKQKIPSGSINKTGISVSMAINREISADKVVSEAEKYLNHLNMTSGLNATMLYQFQQDFNQMLYTALEQKGIQAHQLLNDNESIEMQMRASLSVVDAIEWIKHVLKKAVEYVEEVEKSQSVIDKVRNYVSINIYKELTREEIASNVFLNPDYLDRIFKKETGVSVNKYLLLERIKIAKEYLSTTDIPVSTIAVKLGYINISNFSGMFKKHTGMKPAEYRKAFSNVHNSKSTLHKQ